MQNLRRNSETSLKNSNLNGSEENDKNFESATHKIRKLNTQLRT